jgi:hypothetical protein
MSIKKTWLVAVGALVLMTSASVFADLELKPYGAAQYRFRERVHMQNGVNPADEEVTGTTIDYMNLFAWRTGVRAKVDDKLSLQLQIGNDWNAGEGIAWENNNTVGSRVGYNNLYVHIASFKWNPGPVFVEGGVIPISSNGSLDLLERSINFGNYGHAGFQGWSTELMNSLLGIRVGVPILKDDVKLGVELVQSVIDQRTQSLGLSDDIPGNPTSPLFVLTVPVDVTGLGLKVTPEVAIVMNRNYNSVLDAGDHEILGGLAASYKLSDAVSFSLSGGYGMVSNENSKTANYVADKSSNTAASPAPSRNTNVDSATAAGIAKYNSNGLLVCVGTAVKAGPGTIQVDFKYNSAVNTEAEDATKYDYVYFDLRYAYKAHDKVVITPRYRLYDRFYPESNASNWRMENRFELILEGSF